MPGWELNPNIDAAKTLAFDFNFVGDLELSFGQFPTDDNDIKVQNFVIRDQTTKLSIRINVKKIADPT